MVCGASATEADPPATNSPPDRLAVRPELPRGAHRGHGTHADPVALGLLVLIGRLAGVAGLTALPAQSRREVDQVSLRARTLLLLRGDCKARKRLTLFQECWTSPLSLCLRAPDDQRIDYALRAAALHIAYPPTVGRSPGPGEATALIRSSVPAHRCLCWRCSRASS